MKLDQPNLFEAVKYIIFALLLFTPFLVSSSLYNGVIVAKELWFLAVVALILFATALTSNIAKTPQPLSINITDVLLLIFYLYCLIRAYYTNYTPIVYNHKLQMLSGCLVVYFFVKAALTENDKIKNIKATDFFYFILFVVLLSGLLQAIYGILQLYGYYPSNHGLFKITGSFFNPAPYALYLATVFPMALAIYAFLEIPAKEGKPIRSLQSIFTFLCTRYFLLSVLKQTAAATAISIIIVLPATMIRASWIGALAGLLIVVWFALKHKKIQLPQSILSILATKTTRILLVLLGVVINGGSSLFLYKVKEGSSKGKSLIWEVTLGEIANNPIFGHGVGRFEAEYNNWQGQYFASHPGEMKSEKGLVAGNTKYCFNEYLEMAGEVGIVGITLFLAFIGSVLFYATKGSNTINMMLLPTLAAFLVIAAISYPFYNTPLQLLFFVVVAALSTQSRDLRMVRPPKLLRYGYGIASGILALLIATHLYDKQIAFNNWKEAKFVYSYENFTDANKLYQANMNNLQYEGPFLQEYGKSLLMNNQSNLAITILKQASHLTTDYVLYCTLGDAYKNEKEYKNAENAYLTATQMVPHKLYPNYLMAQLYDKSGNYEMAITKARQVLEMSAKTKSLAEKEIKAEMRNILEKREILKAN